MKAGLLALVGMFTILVCPARATEEKVNFSRFGTVTLYHATPHPAHVVLFISGDGGWNLGVVDMARELATMDVLVAGVDITHYLKELESSSENCSYPAGDFEELSKFVQKKLDYPAYVTPVLVGYSSGATLAYAVLVQAPFNTFLGGISLGFCPDLMIRKPFCHGSGIEWDPGPKGKGVLFRPTKTLEVPWIAMQGTIDQVCDPPSTEKFVQEVTNGRIVMLPKVGHGYSVPKNWMPQFKQAFADLVAGKPPEKTEAATPPGTTSPAAPPPAAPSEPPVSAAELKGLPLIEVPAKESGKDWMAIHITGDGGWGVTDKGLSSTLAENGVPVVGLNSLKYFWSKRTPAETADMIDMVARHYLDAWKKEKLLLIGYSFGADILPPLVNMLPAATREKVAMLALLGPSADADFAFHFSDWVSSHPHRDSIPTKPEIAKIQGMKILCFYAEGDKDAICKDLDPAQVQSFPVPGGHRFRGRFDPVAQAILKEIP